MNRLPSIKCQVKSNIKDGMSSDIILLSALKVKYAITIMTQILHNKLIVTFTRKKSMPTARTIHHQQHQHNWKQKSCCDFVLTLTSSSSSLSNSFVSLSKWNTSILSKRISHTCHAVRHTHPNCLQKFWKRLFQNLNLSQFVSFVSQTCIFNHYQSLG